MKCQVGIDHINKKAVASDEPGKASGRHNTQGPEPLTKPLDKAIGHGCKPLQDTGFHTLLRVPTQEGGKAFLGKRDRRKEDGFLDKSLERDLRSRDNQAPFKDPFSRNIIAGQGGPVIQNEKRRFVEP